MGRLTISWFSAVRPSSGLLVLTSGAAAVTSTVSPVEPMSSEVSMRAVWATSKVTPLRTNFLNPAASTVNEYSPTGRNSIRYSPWAFVVTERWRPVPTLAAVTFASTITAPVLSVTLPIMLVVVIWALRARLASPRKQVQRNTAIFIATTSSSSHKSSEGKLLYRIARWHFIYLKRHKQPGLRRATESPLALYGCLRHRPIPRKGQRFRLKTEFHGEGVGRGHHPLRKTRHFLLGQPEGRGRDADISP